MAGNIDGSASSNTVDSKSPTKKDQPQISTETSILTQPAGIMQQTPRQTLQNSKPPTSSNGQQAIQQNGSQEKSLQNSQQQKLTNQGAQNVSQLQHTVRPNTQQQGATDNSRGQSMQATQQNGNQATQQNNGQLQSSVHNQNLHQTQQLQEQPSAQTVAVNQQQFLQHVHSQQSDRNDQHQQYAHNSQQLQMPTQGTQLVHQQQVPHQQLVGSQQQALHSQPIQMQNLQQWQQNGQQDQFILNVQQPSMQAQIQAVQHIPQQHVQQSFNQQQPIQQQMLSQSQMNLQQLGLNQSQMNLQQLGQIVQSQMNQQQQLNQHQVSQQHVPILAMQQQLLPQNLQQIYHHQQPHQQQQLQHHHQQQQQQQLQQPMSVLQTPTLPVPSQPQLSAPISTATSATKSPSKAVKKGRFRVVKGGKGAKNGECGNNGTGANEGGADAASEQVTNTGSAVTVGDGQGANEGNNTVAQAVSTKKKGRFVVTTGGSNVGSSLTAGTAPSSCTAGTLNNVGLGNAGAPHTPIANPDEMSLPAVPSNPSIGAMPPHLLQPTMHHVAQTQPQMPSQYGQLQPSMAQIQSTITDTPNANSDEMSLPAVPSNPSIVSMPPHLLQQTMQHVVQTQPQISSQYGQLQPSMAQMQSAISGGMHIPMATLSPIQFPSQTMGLVEVNGQIMAISAPPAASPNTSLHKQPFLPQQIQMPQLQGQGLFGNPAAQVVATNVGAQSQSLQLLPPHQADVQKHPPPPPSQQPRVAKEITPGNGTTSSTSATTSTNIAKVRTAGTSGSTWGIGSANRASVSGGNNGRLLGTGGVGKVLHNIECLRLEVVEADRSLASLKLDNRFLRDKNKELETKNLDLERRLAEEKSIREALEVKYRSFRQKIRDQSDNNHSQPIFSGASKQTKEQRNSIAENTSKNLSKPKESEQLREDAKKKDHNPVPAAGAAPELVLSSAPKSVNGKIEQTSTINGVDPTIENKNSHSIEKSPELRGMTNSDDSMHNAGKVEGRREQQQVQKPQQLSSPRVGDSARKLSTTSETQINAHGQQHIISPLPLTDVKTMNEQPNNSQPAPHPVVSHGSIAKKFDPLGAGVADMQKKDFNPHTLNPNPSYVLPASNNSVPPVYGMDPTRQVSQTCIPSMTSLSDGNISIPVIVTSQAPSPEKNHNGNGILDENVANLFKFQGTTAQHFDPLGTPTNGDRICVGANLNQSQLNGIAVSPHGIPTMSHMNGGNVTMPVIVPLPLVHPNNQQQMNIGVQYQQQQQQQQQHNNPFDDILLLSQSGGQNVNGYRS